MLSPVRSHLRSGRAAASFVRLAKHRAHRRWTAQLRWQSSAAAVAVDQKQDVPETLAVPSTPRKNELGVQQLSEYIYKQLFPRGGEPPPEELVKLAKDHLGRHELLGKTTDITDPIAFDLPGLQAPQTQTLDEHFHKLGMDSAEPFLSHAKEFAQASLPTLPRAWVRQSGWTKYYHQDGVGPIITEKINAPDETMLSFDVEVMWKANPFAVMACAASPTAWYVWLSPWLLGEEENERHLVPLGDPTKDRVIVGHNIGYDRARILEEYDLKQTRNCFLDTMSLHVAVNGMCSQQRPTWMKHKKNRELREKIARETDSVELATMLADESLSHDEEELWVGRSSINSLRDVAKFHLNIAMDKSVRDNFGELDREEILERLDELITYCGKDVEITQKVYSIVFPNFLETCPHPVSFAALRHLSSVILPVNETWDSYISEAEAKYQELSRAVEERLVALTNEALKVKDNQEKWNSDPWLRQLDWSGQEIKYTKGTKKEPPRIMKNQKMPGMPKWYKDLFPKKDGPINISVRTRVAPLLLKLSWSGHPLFWSDQYGWTFRVPLEEKNAYSAKAMKPCDMKEEKVTMLRDDTEGAYFKVPHKDGPLARCANPLAKSYLNYFENGVLTSQYPYAKEALEMNASCSYWISARERIRSQLVVYEKELQLAKGQEQEETTLGYILPQIIPMGTVTRRAVENTWLTASNAKKTRVGSELKAMVKAPPGYSFVGADVDSEELWIASVLGDAVFKIHGGNAIGFMTLEGSKAAGTDLHSRTASILGISRNNAKLLRQFNPALSDEETLKTALQLYAATKGQQSERRILYKRKFWRGGTESFVFNKLEEFAEQRQPRTPVLGAGITEALMSSYVSKGGFLTSRINWAIQSSGVDYLHLLIVAMDYLIRRFNIHARLAITVHDEIRYLVKNEDNYRAAMALQVANIWTRCMFAQQIGINDLPQSCAFFSAVDIDHVLRKEVDMPCVTPSHKTPIPPGESIDIQQLLAKGQEAFLDESIVPRKYPPKLDDIPYKPRVPVMKGLIEQDASTTELTFIKAQITADLKELVEICAEKRRMINELVEKQPVPRVKQRILPYNSEPELLPVDEPFMVSDAFRADQSKRSDAYYRRPDWERTTQWTRSTVASKGTAH
ncbi:DNA polymerase gamma, mitochondrial [Cytospora mali]|uniref:Mitochondrial DNA polymerase catalytic subunit n=1 Tax=Cytospora mali TaxID=578113 RepID=A0A194VNF4_CYTMA|nr:DNA polymerase gamma, mitochondrial [Valsa mali]